MVVRPHLASSCPEYMDPCCRPRPILAYHAGRKTFLVVSHRRNQLDALLASAGVMDVRPHLASSCPEYMDPLAAVHARINSAETELGHSINKSTEIIASLQHNQSQISNLQQELDILRRRGAWMRLSELSTSPRHAPSSPASSEFSSAFDTDVVSVECDDTDESSTSGTVAIGSSSYPGKSPQ